MRRGLTIALVALLAGCGDQGQGHHRTGDPAPGEPRPDTIAVVGDSLAAGRLADAPEHAFPDLVANALQDGLTRFGVPGATTAQLARQPGMVADVAVIVEAGTNDFLHQTPRRQFKTDYRALLAQATSKAPKAKLVCLTIWMPDDVARQVPGAKIPPKFYDTTIRHACAKGTVVDVSPFFANRGADGFHPDTAGHADIAQAIEQALR